jgi:hypothetical protein
MAAPLKRFFRSPIVVVISTRKQPLYLSRRPATQLRWSSSPESRLQLHWNPQALWSLLPKRAMHQCSFPVSYDPPVRIGSATGTGVGEHARVCPGTAAKKEGGSLVRGTQESDRTAPPAVTPDEVRAGAVFPGSGCAEHQATGAVPQLTDNTHCGSCLLAEVRERPRRPRSWQPKRHSDHGLFQHPQALTLRTRSMRCYGDLRPANGMDSQ